MNPPLPPEELHDLQCCSVSKVNVKTKPLQNLQELTNVDFHRQTRTSSSPSKADVRTRFSLAENKMQRVNRKAKSSNERKKSKTFEQKHKTTCGKIQT